MSYINLRRFFLPTVTSGLLIFSTVLYAGSASADPDSTKNNDNKSGSSATGKTSDELVKEKAKTEKKSNGLLVEAEKASENYNLIHEKKQKVDLSLEDLKSDLEDIKAETQKSSDLVAASTIEQMQNQDSLSETTALVLSGSKDEFIDRLAIREMTNDAMMNKLKDFESDTSRLKQQKKQIAEKEKEATKLEASAKKQKTKAFELYGQSEKQIKTLNVKIEKSLEKEKPKPIPTNNSYSPNNSTSHKNTNNRGGSRSSNGKTTSGKKHYKTSKYKGHYKAPKYYSTKAQKVVAFAKAQLGKRYVYAGAGPNVWDCSGLTMVAWGRAGVSLPHHSGMQKRQTKKVSINHLKPGDLVYYYPGATHVGIYIGHGKIIHAANPRDNVQVLGVRVMPIVGASRPG